MNAYPIRFAAQMREQLRALRKQRGLTQAQLGAQLGVSQARIAEIEANPGLVSLDQMLLLLSKMGASLSLDAGGPPSLRYPLPAETPPVEHAVREDVALPPLPPAGTGLPFTRKKGSW